MSDENGQNTASEDGKGARNGPTGESKGAIAPALRRYPSPRSVRIGSLLALRREMSAVYKDARTGRIPTSEATRLTFILSQLATLWQLTEFEDRLRALEQKAAVGADQPSGTQLRGETKCRSRERKLLCA